MLSGGFQSKMAAQRSPLYIALGQLVRAARGRADLTQDKLSDMVGLTRTSVANIERGGQKIQVHTLYALARALEVSPEDLLPSSSAETRQDIEERLPKDLAGEEREWVKRVLS